MSEFTFWIEKHRDWFIEFLRMFLGVVLIMKGVYFLQDMSTFLTASPHNFESTTGTGWAYGTLAHVIIFANILGGAAVMIGFLTRIAIPVQLPALLVVALSGPMQQIYFKGGSPFEMWLLIVMLVLLMFYGPGRLSVDYYVFRKRRSEPT
ncbi:MAG: hypothetical protein CVV45_15990 [Spirochaetae bacterium HGW-Spirochaetae-10]|nr:MAG: hypothetical protein CVV45_15990 [Spirochaetae bacterium HGW-Spirochaetae-10]